MEKFKRSLGSFAVPLLSILLAFLIGGTTVFGTLENGGLSAGAINTELVPAEKVEKYNAYLEQMKAGTFMK